jgi:hypothetical protein
MLPICPLPKHWEKGSLNKANHFTKHHPTSHHQAVLSSWCAPPRIAPAIALNVSKMLMTLTLLP